VAVNAVSSDPSSSVVFNVTVVSPVTKEFLSIRPGDASGTPSTSNINWAAGGANIANAVTVQLPTSGDINIFVNGTVGHVLIDVAGYCIASGTGADGVQGIPGTNGDQEIQDEQGDAADRTDDVTTLAGTRSIGTVNVNVNVNVNANATTASFRYPQGVAVDGSGNVYVADKENHLNRKIGTNKGENWVACADSARRVQLVGCHPEPSDVDGRIQV
jgi:hypothetical protein